MITQLCDWLAATALSHSLQNTSWAVPLIQTVHILGIAVMLTSMAMLGLRLLGLAGRQQSMQQVAARLLPWMWRTLAVMLATGALLIVAEPTRSLPNQMFQLKMVLLATVLVLSYLIEYSRRASVIRAAPGGEIAGAPVLGLLILIAWTGIVVAGRWIAYV